MTLQTFLGKPRLSTPLLHTAGTVCAALGLLGTAGALRAGTAETDGKEAGKKVVEKKAEPRVKFSVFAQAGFTVGSDRPDDGQLFGRVFDDRSVEPMLNQLTFTVERALVPEPGKYDYGFKLQLTGGTDARFLKTIGLLDNINNDRYSAAVVEAFVSAHAPWLFENGIDFKLGQFVTLEGSETIDPRSNYLYSHNYIFNFAIPFQHLGLLSTIHVNKYLDLYAGVTRGANTSLADNNDRPAFHGGFGLDLLDGKLGLLATTHLGPENPVHAEQFLPGLDGNDDLRYFNSLVVTFKPNDKLTLVTDAVYTLEDSFGGAECYGVSQLAACAVHPKVSLVGRAEIFRDDDGFFVAQFAKNDDFVNLQRGDLDNLDPRTVGGGATTYAAFTAGVNVKPNDKLVIRPEIRYDKALEGNRAFSDSSKSYSLTGGIDVIISF